MTDDFDANKCTGTSALSQQIYDDDMADAVRLIAALSERDQYVLKLKCQGYTSVEIGALTQRTRQAIEKRCAMILPKLNVNSMIEAAVVYTRSVCANASTTKCREPVLADLHRELAELRKI